MTQDQTTAMLRALLAVRAERERQHARWGEQDLPDGTGLARSRTGYSDAEEAYAAKARATMAFGAGLGSYRLLLDEEVLEAFAETDPVKLRAELVQVAAVAVQWVEALDRRAAQYHAAGGETK